MLDLRHALKDEKRLVGVTGYTSDTVLLYIHNKLWQQPTCSFLITSVKERAKNSTRSIAGLNMQHADGDNCGHSRFECCELSDAVFRHLSYVSLCIIRLLFKGGEVKMPAEV